MKRFLIVVLIFFCALACKNAADVPNVLMSPPFNAIPNVILSYPSSATPNISSTQQVYVEFDHDMDTESAQNSFSLTGSVSTSGRYDWQGFRRLVYRTDSPIPAGNSYVMRVAAGAKSKDNAALNLDYIVHFTVGSTVQSPTVVSTTPAGSAQGVATNTSITVVFSRPMDTVSVQAAFSLSPSAAGTFSWNSGNTTLTYQPASVLSAGTTYTVSVSTTAKDAGGVAMSSGFSASFQVGSDLVRPTISSVTESGTATAIANNQAGIYKDSSFIIAFSEPMEAVGTKNAVTLTKLSDSTSVSSVSTWNGTFTQLTVDPVDALEPSSTYRLTVTTSAKDLASNALISNFTVTITVNNTGGAVNSDYLTILSASKTSPAAVEALDATNTGVLTTVDILGGPTATLKFVFSRPLDLSTIGDNIFITKILGSCSPPPGITGISFENQAPYTNNVLRVDLSGMGMCEYELKLLGTRGEIKSAVSGAETGTWMQQDMKIYLKGQ